MNIKQIRQQSLDMLIKMASNPATKAHAWHRAKELDKDDSSLFGGIAKELEEHMQRLSAGQPQNGG